MADRVEEPADDATVVLVGYEPDRWAYERVDDVDPAEPRRWYVIAGERTDPELWAEIVRDKRTGERLPVEVLRRSAVTHAR